MNNPIHNNMESLSADPFCDFIKFLNRPELSDITFIVQKTVFYAHKVVLCSRSPYFYDLIVKNASHCGKQTIEIEIDDFDPDIFLAVLGYFYTNKLCATLSNVWDIHHSAVFYRLPQLAEQCEQFIVNNLNKNNILDVWRSAQQRGMLALSQKCYNYVNTHLANTKNNNISNTNVTIPPPVDTNSVHAPVNHSTTSTTTTTTSNNNNSNISSGAHSTANSSGNNVKFNLPTTPTTASSANAAAGDEPITDPINTDAKLQSYAFPSTPELVSTKPSSVLGEFSGSGSLFDFRRDSVLSETNFLDFLLTDPAGMDTDNINGKFKPPASRRNSIMCRRMSVIAEPVSTPNVIYQQIVYCVSKLLNAERTTLFLYDEETDELCSQVSIAECMIRIPSNRGIAGQVFKTGKLVNARDAYSWQSFESRVDQNTGFKTKNILCAPVFTSKVVPQPNKGNNTSYTTSSTKVESDSSRSGDAESDTINLTTGGRNDGNNGPKVLGVLQVLNKTEGNFTEEDETIALALAELIALLLLQNSPNFRSLSRRLLIDQVVLLSPQGFPQAKRRGSIIIPNINIDLANLGAFNSAALGVNNLTNALNGSMGGNMNLNGEIVTNLVIPGGPNNSGSGISAIERRHSLMFETPIFEDFDTDILRHLFNSGNAGAGGNLQGAIISDPMNQILTEGLLKMHHMSTFQNMLNQPLFYANNNNNNIANNNNMTHNDLLMYNNILNNGNFVNNNNNNVNLLMPPPQHQGNMGMMSNNINNSVLANNPNFAANNNTVMNNNILINTAATSKTSPPNSTNLPAPSGSMMANNTITINNHNTNSVNGGNNYSGHPVSNSNPSPSGKSNTRGSKKVKKEEEPKKDDGWTNVNQSNYGEFYTLPKNVPNASNNTGEFSFTNFTTVNNSNNNANANANANNSGNNSKRPVNSGNSNSSSRKSGTSKRKKEEDSNTPFMHFKIPRYEMQFVDFGDNNNNSNSNNKGQAKKNN